MITGWVKTCEALGTAARNWQRVETRDVAAFGAALQRNQIANVMPTNRTLAAPQCGESIR